MNILFLTQVLPYPLDAGPKVRAHHMLRHLAARHAVTLVSFTRPDDPPEALAHLRTVCAAVYTVPMRRSTLRNLRAGIVGLLTGLPITIVRDEMPALAALLRRLTTETAFDVIHADQLSMAWWGLLAASRTLPALKGPGAAPPRVPRRPRLLLDEHNAIYRLTERMAETERHPLRRLIIQREARAFRRYEAAVLSACDAVLTVTEEDRALLEALLSDDRGQAAGDIPDSTFHIPDSTFHIPHSTFHIPDSTFHIPDSTFATTVIPICVDPEASRPVNKETRTQGNNEAHLSTCLPVPLSTPVILHLGTMFWPPNVAGVLWFAREVLPLIHAEQPAARFVIVGKNPPAEVQALVADPRITVTGYVADATPFLAAADAFVIPLHAGGGMRVKILDAWLWGLPVVSTTIGAEGIAGRDGENILIADDAGAFARSVLRCLADPVLNARLRAAGRAWVEAQYAWPVVYRKVDEVYDRLLAPT